MPNFLFIPVLEGGWIVFFGRFGGAGRTNGYPVFYVSCLILGWFRLLPSRSYVSNNSCFGLFSSAMETGISVYCISFTLSLLVLIFFCYSGLTLLDALFLGLIAYSSYCSVIDFYYCMSSSFFSRISIEFYCSGFYYTGIDGGRIGARFCAFVNGGGGGFERFGGFLVGGAGKLDIPTCFTIIDFVNIRTHDYINLIMYSNNVYHSINKASTSHFAII